MHCTVANLSPTTYILVGMLVDGSILHLPTVGMLTDVGALVGFAVRLPITTVCWSYEYQVLLIQRNASFPLPECSGHPFYNYWKSPRTFRIGHSILIHLSTNTFFALILRRDKTRPRPLTTKMRDDSESPIMSASEHLVLLSIISLVFVFAVHLVRTLYRNRFRRYAHFPQLPTSILGGHLGALDGFYRSRELDRHPGASISGSSLLD